MFSLHTLRNKKTVCFSLKHIFEQIQYLNTLKAAWKQLLLFIQLIRW